MLRVLRMFPFSQAAIKLQLHGGALRRGVGGDRRLRLFSLPLVASAEAKPLLAGKTSYGRKSGCVVAPIWRDNVQVVSRASWGRV